MVFWLGASVFAVVIGLFLIAMLEATRERDNAVWARSSMSKRSARNPRLVTAVRIFAGTVFFANFLIQVGVVNQRRYGDASALLDAFYATLQVGAMGANMEVMRSEILGSGASVPWSWWATILANAAPLLGFGFVLSFFRSTISRLRLWISGKDEVCVFSVLTEESATLAESIHRQRVQDGRKHVIMFPNIQDEGDSSMSVLVTRARSIGAFLHSSDVLETAARYQLRGHDVKLFLMGGEEANIAQVAAVNDMLSSRARSAPFRRRQLDGPLPRFLPDRDTMDVYVFTKSPVSRMLFSHALEKTRIRLIDTTRILIHTWLWRDPNGPSSDASTNANSGGPDLFRGAVLNGSDFHINALVLGLGHHSGEMVKALSWYCQMDTERGQYVLDVHAVERDQIVVDRFARDYPELVQPHRGVDHDGLRQDQTSTVTLHGGVDVRSSAFLNLLESMESPTFIFVSLGSDEENLKTTLELRRHFALRGRAPLIVALHRSTFTNSLNQIDRDITVKAEPSIGRIDLLGSTTELYSYSTIMRSEIELSGLLCHMEWAKRTQVAWHRTMDEFWRNQYFYGSSIAVPIHWRARRVLAVHGAQLPPRTAYRGPT